ncbi:molybdotransferase-like divisome protein Glp [Granulicoccus sp. GXG6511]|uniref:molybdotransferase-like divisome protein Glp n=1 Tax=Granulicoccus sp. GXG6511 TaxID=3381351 RepID=UPI003D7DB301
MRLFGRKKLVEPEPVEEVPPPTLPTPPEPNANGYRDWQAQRDWILDQIEPLRPFGMQLLDALGLSLCEDIESDVSLPGFDNSAMDGYAIQAADTKNASEKRPATLAVVGEIAAGAVADRALAPGTAMKIMTGAPVPEGADTVVQYELTDRGAEDVKIFTQMDVDKNIRRKGSDITEGERLLSDGDIIDARTIGLLAGIGIDKVMARPRPRVVVLATGSELVEPGLQLTELGQLFDSNSFMLAAQARAAGAQVFRVGVVGDDPEMLKQTISDQLVRADLIVTSGGISEGDWDVVKEVAPELGMVDFAQIGMQPGKPQGFGLIGDDETPMLMLPGNPVSSFVSFEVFVRPVIRKLMGVTPLLRPTVTAVTNTIIRSKPGRARFVRAGIRTDAGGRRVVEQVGQHSSHLLGGLQRANALLLIDDETEVIKPGEIVRAWMLDE